MAFEYLNRLDVEAWSKPFPIFCDKGIQQRDEICKPAGKELTSWLSRLWCLAVSLSLSHWYPVSGVVLDCIDS